MVPGWHQHVLTSFRFLLLLLLVFYFFFPISFFSFFFFFGLYSNRNKGHFWTQQWLCDSYYTMKNERSERSPKIIACRWQEHEKYGLKKFNRECFLFRRLWNKGLKTNLYWSELTFNDRQRSPDGSSPPRSDQPGKNFRNDVFQALRIRMHDLIKLCELSMKKKTYLVGTTIVICRLACNPPSST